MKELNIGAVLTAKRKEKGITQEDLAHYIGVSKASVSKWETGQSYPDITFLPQLATYFNISIDQLIDYQPQMSKEDIKKLYHRLAEDFVANDVEQVLAECKEIVHKYYSCYPLLLQVAVLYLNHVEFYPDKNEELLNGSIDLCKRIQVESDDIPLIEMATYLQSICLLSLRKPETVPDLLENTKKPLLFEEILVASAYFSTGKVHQAEEIVQVRLYQYVLGIVQDSLVLMQYAMNDTPRFNEILNRTEAVFKTYNLLTLHPNTAFSFLLTAAQGYTVQNRPEKALEMLSLFGEICESELILHADEFFTKIGPWLADLDLGVEPPRSNRKIKESMLGCIESPIFSALFDYPEYKNIVKLLKLKLEVD